MTPVIFRIDRYGKDKEVIALFYNEMADHRGNIMAYVHLGQHCSVSWRWAMEKTRLATPKEYAELLRELKQIGYDDLKIMKRRQFKDGAE